MRADSTYFRRFKQPYRNAWELCSAVGWLLCAVYFFGLFQLEIIDRNLAVIVFGLCGAMFFWRLYEGWSILVARSYLHGYGTAFMSIQTLIKKTNPDHLWLGLGFEWTPDHSQKLYDLSKYSAKHWRLNKLALWLTGRSNSVMSDDDQGLAALHGLNCGEADIYRPLKNFEGGLCIVGTTQAGKGVFLGTAIAQAIIRGDVVITIDPKGGGRMENVIRKTCAIVGRDEPLIFSTDNDPGSVRLDPLYTYGSSGEIATRIISVMPPSSDGTFRAFAWSAVDTVAQALIELNISPSVRTIETHINNGINELLGLMLDKLIENKACPEWRQKALAFIKGSKKELENVDPLKLKISWYENVLDKTHHTRPIESALKVYHHSAEHYAKITASLIPVFALLNNGDMQKIISPDRNDPKDLRPIISLPEVIEQKQVLYIALGSMQNADVATAAASMMLADLASVAGHRYKLKKGGVRICLFVDEVSNVVNAPLIEILNKGAEGGIYTTVAMQTMADLEERLGSAAAARKVIGNLNNMVALRTKDGLTRDVFTETMGKTYIKHVDTSLSTHADNYSGIPSYNAGASHKSSSKREDVIPGEYYSMLPNCQFFANVSGGKLYKLRSPILIDENDYKENASEKDSPKPVKTADEEIREALELLEQDEKEKKEQA